MIALQSLMKSAINWRRSAFREDRAAAVARLATRRCVGPLTVGRLGSSHLRSRVPQSPRTDLSQLPEGSALRGVRFGSHKQRSAAKAGNQCVSEPTAVRCGAFCASISPPDSGCRCILCRRLVRDGSPSRTGARRSGARGPERPPSNRAFALSVGRSALLQRHRLIFPALRSHLAFWYRLKSRLSHESDWAGSGRGAE